MAWWINLLLFVGWTAFAYWIGHQIGYSNGNTDGYRRGLDNMRSCHRIYDGQEVA